jgi:hypothetical protein
MKVRFQGKDYAIDMKSGEDGRNPWYDMGRLDTFEEKHLQKYNYEYYISVRWKNHVKPEVVNVYIEPAYQSVGYHKPSGGILFRPYDGKIRPKCWQDFDSGKSYWVDKKSFISGFVLAKNYRRMMYMADWYKEMNEDQRKKIAQAFRDIEMGKDNALLGKLSSE